MGAFQAFPDHASVVTLKVPAVILTTTDETGVDMLDYEGKVLVTLNAAKASAGTNPTLDVKLQSSADNSTGWTDVPGGAFTQVTGAADSSQTVSINADSCQRYLRAHSAVGGTASPSFVLGLTASGLKKSY